MKRTLQQVSTAVIAGLLFTILISCDAGSFVGPQVADPSEAASIEIVGLTGPVLEQDTTSLTASVLDQDGQPLTVEGLVWSSSNPGVAEVESTGGGNAMLTTSRPGTATIDVSYGSLEASTVVEVHNRPVDLLYVSGSDQSAAAGAKLDEKLVVFAVDRRGDPVSGVSVEFRVTSGGGSVAPTAALTDSRGFADAEWTLGPSSVQEVRAVADPNQPRVKNMKDSVVVFTATAVVPVTSLNVTPDIATVAEGDSLQLNVSATSDGGGDIGDPGVSWESSDTSVATVSKKGVLRGRKGGKTFAIARYSSTGGTVSDSSEVTVTAETRTIATIEVTPRSATVDTGASVDFNAAGTLTDGSPVSVSVTWTATGGTVDSEGLFTAGTRSGTFHVIATHAQGPADTADVSIVAPTTQVARVAVSPATTTLDVGAAKQLAASAFDAAGTELSGVTFTWTSTDGGIVAVSTSGLVTAKAVGSALIIAAAAGIADTASVTVRETTSPPPPPDGPGVWMSAAEIATLPTSGAAWSNLKSMADQSCGTPDLADQEDNTNVCIMAKALIFARTGATRYRDDVVAAIRSIVTSGTYPGRALALGRELGAYVIAADLIGLQDFDSSLDGSFRLKLMELRTTPTSSGPSSLIDCYEVRPNNWGNQCGGSLAAVDAYLGDQAGLDRVATVFRGWLGDRSAYASFNYGNDLSWQANPSRPVGINPAGATKDGHSIDGVLPEEMRRCGSFQWPVCETGYAWEAMQGVVATAWILHRQGYPAFEWSDQAIRRAADWLHQEAGWPAESDDTWIPHILNYVYGTSYPAPVPSRPGKNVGWSDWTHGG